MREYAIDTIFGLYVCTPFKWEYLVMLIAVTVWIVAGRWFFDGYMRMRTSGTAKTFSLAEVLTKEDNKAVGVDFACFLFSLCWITRGSLQDLPAGTDDTRYFGAFFVYQIIGYVLIAIARLINDRLILRSVDNTAELVQKKNIGVACAQGGSTIATAVIIAAAAGGVSVNFWAGVGATFLYWAVGQSLLVAYCFLVDCVTSLPVVQTISAKLVRRDDPTMSIEPDEAFSESSEAGPTSLLKQAAEGNVAAGLTLGVDMVAASIVIASPVIVGYSVVAWIIFAGTCLGLVTPMLHLYLDHVVMRGASITVNILRHKNWGAAVLFGALKLITAIVLQSLYRANCDVSDGQSYSECYPPKDGGSLGEKLVVVAVPDVFNWQSVLDLLLLLLVILVAKGIYFLRFRCQSGASDFSLDEALANPNNNAIAVSIAAYSFAQGMCIAGAAHCPNENAGTHGANIAFWTAVGCILLYCAFLINDFVLLHHIDNTKMLRENNLAVALFEAGSFVSCGVILRSNLLGSGSDESADDYGRGVAIISLYWIVCQTILLLFAYLYRLITSFDDHAELAAGNASAGLSGGLTLIALSLVMSYSISYYSSLIIFLPISVTGAVALVILRFVVDWLVLPGDRLDEEIKRDRNWGAALVEGLAAIGVAFVGQLFVPPPGNPQESDLICPSESF